MSDNNNKSVVVAQFENEEKAQAAAGQMKDWDKASKEISLGAIQILSMKDGKVQSKAAGSRKTGGGAKAGAIVGVVAGIFSGGLTLLAGAAYGALAGGVLGSLKKKGLKISDAELQKVQVWLDGGASVLVVMCDEGEMAATKAQLKTIGASQAMSFVMPADAVAMLDDAAAQLSDAPDATAATPEAAAAQTEVVAANVVAAGDATPDAADDADAAKSGATA